MEFEEDQPRKEQGRINDGRRMYRDSGDQAVRDAEEAPRDRPERRERREAPPQRQAVSRDPFFDKPYESTLAADAQPVWEASAKGGGARSGVSANIKPKKKVAALFKTAD